VDLDDVLAETAQHLVGALARHFGRVRRFEDTLHFDLQRAFGLSAAEHESFMELVHRDDELEAIAPRPGAATVLERWRAAGCEVAVMTGRPPSTEAVSRRWLARHGFAHDRLGFVDKYGRRDWRGGRRRGLPLAALAGHGFSLAVEDSPSTASFLAGRLRVPVALLDRPWNRDPEALGSDARARVVRCRDWSEVAGRFPVAADAVRRPA